MRYQILPVKKKNNSMQYSAITRTQELTRPTHTSIELKFRGTVKFDGLNPLPLTASTLKSIERSLFLCCDYFIKYLL